MTHLAQLRGRSVQVLRPSKGDTGPKRWQTLIRIPHRASKRILRPVSGKAQQGVEYVWWSRGKRHCVRIHDADPSVQPTPGYPAPNARVGWVVRIAQGKRYMDPEGRVHPWAELNPNGPGYNEFIVNETHIPIVPPSAYP